MKNILFIVLFFLTVGSNAQQIHTPGELLKIIENSEVSYELRDLKDSIPTFDQSTNINSNNAYRQADEEGIIQLYVYKKTTSIDSLIKVAEKAFIESDIKRARNAYLEVLEIDPHYYQVMTYIGQTYSIEGKYTKAKKWYQDAISKNYIDYIAHWFLADLLYQEKEYEQAQKEIAIAKVLNRNNPRIDKSYNRICLNKACENQEWSFTPQIKIEEGEEKHQVAIYFKPEWLGYAIGKALWGFEPGYKQSMGVNGEAFSTIEEKECLLSLLANIQNNKEEYLKKDPAFKALLNAFEKKMIDEFIFYEIVLVEYPYVAYQLPNEFIDKIAFYILEVRSMQS